MDWIVYNTLWSEGDVVAKATDRLFAIGADACTGYIVYVTKKELENMDSFNVVLKTDDKELAESMETACYHRRP